VSSPSYSANLSVTDPRVLRTGMSMLLRGSWEHKRIFGWSFLSGIVFALLQVYSATVLGHVTDNLIVPAFQNGRPAFGAIVSGAILVLVIAICRAIAVAARRVFAALTQYSLYADYRHRLNRQYTDLPLAWHRRHPTGQLLSNVNADVEAMWFVMAPFPFALGTVAMLIYAIISILSADLWLGLVALILIPTIVVINVAYQHVVSPLITRAQQLRAEVSQVAHESFDGAAVVKALGREDQETTRFAESSHRLRDALIRVGYVRGWFDPMMDALPSIGVVAVIAIGAWRIKAGAIDTGTLVQVSYLFTLMALPLRSIGWVLGELPRLVVGWGRVRKVLEAKADHDFGSNSMADGGPVPVAFENVGFRYHDGADPNEMPDADVARADAEGSPLVLDGVTLRLDPRNGSRVIAVVGTTGSGKSTLTMLATRLMDVDSGSVKLDGRPVEQYADGAIPEQTALVLQQAFVFDDSVRGNVTLGGDYDDAAVWRALRLAQAETFVRRLPDGLDTVLGERGGSLSGGQRQRIALARAVLREPRLLVLDDATSAVDPTVELAILDGLRSEQVGASILVVAYRKATIALADEVIFLSHGRIAGQGTHEELSATNPEYRALVNAYDEAAIARRLLEQPEDDAELAEGVSS
jgi:ATP-binding cassette subfamily B protein